MSHPRIEEVSDSDLESDPEEVDIDDFDDADIMRRVEPAAAPRAPQQQQQQQQPPRASGGSHVLPDHASTLPPSADRSQYNSFQCLYPVYFDATRSRAEGRRVPSSIAVKNPLAREIANACSRLMLPTLLEPDKIHPKDWSNPGRVKVGLKKVGAATRSTGGGGAMQIANKHHLYILVAQHLRETPTTDDSIGLRVRMGGKLEPEQGKPYPRPSVPRGWKMGELLPYTSAAMTGGGVSENLFKDMMKEMQGGGDPMSALMGGFGGAGGGGGEAAGGNAGSAKKEKKKDKKKGKA
jgi:signal recognition particle subunit SRP19